MVKRVTRKQRRKQELKIPDKPVLKTIVPLTINQKKTFDSFNSNKHLLLTGCAGVGKTFLAVYLALKNVVNEESDYKKIIIIRSAVASRDQGYLPGTEKQKMEVYEAPYVTICNELFGRSDTYRNLKLTKTIEFDSTSFLRGLTFNDAIIIFDEFQSSSFHEMDTLITRIGKNCKLIICGDYNQNDLIKSKYDTSGFSKFFNIISKMNCFDVIEFSLSDIVRSGMVKTYLTEKYKLGY